MEDRLERISQQLETLIKMVQRTNNFTPNRSAKRNGIGRRTKSIWW